ncbi:MAG: HAD family hydrolase [bacterium]|nr:HAD family hydrolase [bacterium]
MNQPAQLAKLIKEKEKRSLIFDFDETLFFLILPWDKHQEELGRLALSLGDKITKENLANDVTGLINQIISVYGKAAKDKLYKMSAEFEVNNLEKVLVNDGLVEFVKKYQDQHRFFIWSSNMSAAIEPILKDYGLLEIFDKVITKDRVDLIKPYPDGFYQIYNPEVDKRSDFMMIGDSGFDQEVAKRVGIDFFKINYF